MRNDAGPYRSRPLHQGKDFCYLAFRDTAKQFACRSAAPTMECQTAVLSTLPRGVHLLRVTITWCVLVSSFCLFVLQFCEPSKGSRLARLPVLRFGRQTKEPRFPCPHCCCDAAPGNEGKVQVHTTPGGEEATSLTVPQGMWVIGQWAFPCMSEAASAA